MIITERICHTVNRSHARFQFRFEALVLKASWKSGSDTILYSNVQYYYSIPCYRVRFPEFPFNEVIKVDLDQPFVDHCYVSF